MEISSLLSIDPSLRQTVLQNTRGFKTLDVIVTNLSKFFNDPVIIPPVMPDRSGHGVPSDHSGVSATPKTNLSDCVKRNKVRKMIRPIPESLLSTFEARLSAEDFLILQDLPASKMVDMFQTIVDRVVCEIFPCGLFHIV